MEMIKKNGHMETTFFGSNKLREMGKGWRQGLGCVHIQLLPWWWGLRVSKVCHHDSSSFSFPQWNFQRLRMSWYKSSKSITWGMCLLLNLLVCVFFFTQGPPP